jgi:hypothetical protein
MKTSLTLLLSAGLLLPLSVCAEEKQPDTDETELEDDFPAIRTAPKDRSVYTEALVMTSNYSDDELMALLLSRGADPNAIKPANKGIFKNSPILFDATF